jgi:hypothetical protein
MIRGIELAEKIKKHQFNKHLLSVLESTDRQQCLLAPRYEKQPKCGGISVGCRFSNVWPASHHGHHYLTSEVIRGSVALN